MLDFELSFRSAFVSLRVGQGSLGRARRRACRRRGAPKSKLHGLWLQIVLRCCVDVVELDLSFKTRIRLSPNSSGQPSCGPDTVLEKNVLFFDQFSIFFGRRGRPLEPDTHTGK